MYDNHFLLGGLGSYYRPGRDTCINTATLAHDVFEGFQDKHETVIAAIDLIIIMIMKTIYIPPTPVQKQLKAAYTLKS